MRQKQFMLMWLLLAIWLVPQSLHAQTVATSPTALENLKSGYYALVMRLLDEEKIPHFLFYDAESNRPRSDEANIWDHNICGTKLARNDYKYVFYVDKNADGTVKIRAWGTNKYWPRHTSDESTYSKIALSDNPQMFQYENIDDWYYLKFQYDDETRYVGIHAYRNSDVYYLSYVYGNMGEFISGAGDPTGEGWYKKYKGTFQFYAMDDMPEPNEIANITYNYSYKGKTYRTDSWDDARVGRPYPAMTIPDFTKAEQPAGNVTGDANIDIQVALNLPFELSKEGDYHYYYLENIQGDGTRLFYNENIQGKPGETTDMQGYRTSAQAETMGGVLNDLWYVTGDLFDGFEFHSVGANNTLKSFAPMQITGMYLTFTPTTYEFSFPITTIWELRQIISGNDKVFSVVPHDGDLSVPGNKSYSWKMYRGGVVFGSPDGEDEACAFRLVPATFTCQLSKGNDGHTYATLSTPFDVKVEGESDVKMYKCRAEYDELYLDEVAAAPAGVGVLLRGDTSEEVTLAVTTGAAALGANVLVGNPSEVTDLSDKLLLGTSSATGKMGFYPAADGVTSLAANQAYILRSSAYLPEGLYIGSGNEADINWTLSDDGVLTVTGTGKMPNYNEKDKLSPWHDKKSAIKKVVIGEGILKVGANAFYRCTNLTEIQLPSTLKIIGDYAFATCNMRYKTLSLPEGIETIGNGAFGTSLLSGIHLPETLKSIGDSAFYGNYFREMYIPKSVTYIGKQFCGNRLASLSSIKVHADNAIYTSKGADGKECNAIIYKEADADGEVALLFGCGQTIIPANVTIIGDGAFLGSTDFRNLGTCVIPNQVKKIGAYAFAFCDMRYLTIGSGVKTIGDRAFRVCSSWREVVSLAEEVPACGAETFLAAKNCTLRVPSKSVEKYKADAIWGKAFSGNIKKDTRVYAKMSGTGVAGTEDAFITVQLLCDNNEDFAEEEVTVIDDLPDNFKMADLAKGLGEYMKAQGYTLDELDEMQPLRYVKEISLAESFKNYAPTSCQSMFDGLYKLVTLANLKYLNTANVTDMSSMFSDCPVTSLDLSAFDTRNVTTMEKMFARCKNIKCFDVSTFDTEKVTNMSRMFFQDQSSFPTDVEIFVGDKFTMANVVNQEKMFCNETATDKGNYIDGYLQKKVGMLDGKPLGAKGSELTIESLSLTDASDYSLTETEPVTVKSATYTRTMANQWGTLCLPYPIDGNSTERQFYSIEDVSGNVIILRRLSGSIEAGTPLLFFQNGNDDTQAKTITLMGSGTLAGKAVDGTKSARLVGTFYEKVLPNGSYFIANNSFRLVDATHKAKVGAYHAYIVYTPVAQAAPATLSIDINVTPTDIDVANWMDDLNDGTAEYYDINGVRTNGLRKGFNIIKVGGKTKKVLVK